MSYDLHHLKSEDPDPSQFNPDPQHWMKVVSAEILIDCPFSKNPVITISSVFRKALSLRQNLNG